MKFIKIISVLKKSTGQKWPGKSWFALAGPSENCCPGIETQRSIVFFM